VCAQARTASPSAHNRAARHSPFRRCRPAILKIRSARGRVRWEGVSGQSAACALLGGLEATLSRRPVWMDEDLQSSKERTVLTRPSMIGCRQASQLLLRPDTLTPARNDPTVDAPDGLGKLGTHRGRAGVASCPRTALQLGLCSPVTGRALSACKIDSTADVRFVQRFPTRPEHT
jgi:hypothetical protein